MVNAAERVLSNSYDTLSETLGVIDAEVKDVHDGNRYTYVISETATQDTDFIDGFFIGGGATEAKRHISFEVSSNKTGVVTLYEDAHSSAGAGTTVDALNANRTSTKVSAHSIRVIPDTFTTNAPTVLWQANIGAAEGPTVSPKFMLASSIDYLIVHDPTAEPANVIIVANWSEL